MLIIERHYFILSSYFVTIVGGQAGRKAGRQAGRKTSRHSGRQVGRWVVLTYHDLLLLRFLTNGFILDAAGVLGLPMARGKKCRTEHLWLVVILKGNIKSK